MHTRFFFWFVYLQWLGALALDIIDGVGNIRHIERDDSNDEWLAASTSLGLLGIIARIKLKIYPDAKVYAKQDM